MVRQVASGEQRTCRRCGWIGPGAPNGKWKCRPCENARNRRRYALLGEEAQELLRQRWRRDKEKQHLDGRAKAKNQQRKAWLREGDVTNEELRQIWERDRGRCRYCSQPVIVRPCFGKMNPAGFDHIIPRSLGGRHTASNLVVCCHPCNTKKGNRLLQPIEL